MHVFDQRSEVCRNPVDLSCPAPNLLISMVAQGGNAEIHISFREEGYSGDSLSEVLSFPKTSLPRPRHDLQGLLPPPAASDDSSSSSSAGHPRQRWRLGWAGLCPGGWRSQEKILLAPQQFVHPSGCLDRLFTSCPHIHLYIHLYIHPSIHPSSAHPSINSSTCSPIH